VKPVRGFLLQVGQGKELTGAITRHARPCAIDSESYYVVATSRAGETTIEGGPYPTEERAFGDVWAITDTSGT
jgi:hypothetical protein